MLELAARTLRPAGPGEVQAVVAEAAASGRTLRISGGGTKLSAIAPVEAEVELSLAGLDRILDYEPQELVLTVQAGARLSDVERLLAASGQMLAFEPPRLAALLRSAGEPTIGGVLGTNLSGPRRIRAGAARDHFLGFSAVSGRGESFKAGGKVVKNVTGYDLCKLMAGSWGTLAVLTEVTLKVLPAPRTEATLMLFGLDGAQACAAMAEALNSPAEVSGAAHLPGATAARAPLAADLPVTALRVEGFEGSVRARSEALAALLRAFGRVELLDADHSRAFWAQVREVEAFAGDPRPLWRLSVPPASGWRAAQAAGGEALLDWAGGQVWLLHEDGDAVRAAARAHGGHARLWRGAAQAASGDLDPALAALSARVKAAFDPQGLFNPGLAPGGSGG